MDRHRTAWLQSHHANCGGLSFQRNGLISVCSLEQQQKKRRQPEVSHTRTSASGFHSNVNGGGERL